MLPRITAYFQGTLGIARYPLFMPTKPPPEVPSPCRLAKLEQGRAEVCRPFESFVYPGVLARAKSTSCALEGGP